MSQYDGLNLPQLLDLMHGLVMPEPVAWLPTTPGWWIVLGWLLAMLLLGGWRLLQRWRRNRYRRDALAELKQIEGNAGLAPNEVAHSVAALLKRTALVAYPREDVASLHGSDWATFLKQSSRDDRQIADAAERLAAAAYRPDADGAALSRPARRWIRLHRA